MPLGNETCEGAGARAVLWERDIFFLLRTAGGYQWQDSVNRRRLTLNRRRLGLNRCRLADEDPQLLAGWRSAQVRVYRRPAVFCFSHLGFRTTPGGVWTDDTFLTRGSCGSVFFFGSVAPFS